MKLHLTSFTEETLYISVPLILVGLAARMPAARNHVRGALLAMLLFYIAFFTSRANLVAVA